MLVFLSGSLFSVNRVSRLGRLDATDGLRVRSFRDALRGSCLPERSLLGTVSARLGSVISWMSDNGRVFAQDVKFISWPLKSPLPPPTMPLLSNPSGPDGVDGRQLAARPWERWTSEGGPLLGGGCG